MNIADMNLDVFLKDQQEQSKLKKKASMICIAKHLCGCATDLTLASIIER